MVAVTKTQTFDEKPPSGGFLWKMKKDSYAVMRKNCYILRDYSLKLVAS
jgi:hypothetical protein